MLRSIWVAFRELVLPTHCVACEAPAPRDTPFTLCSACGRAMAGLISVPHCPRCGRGAGPYAFDLEGCSLCRGRPLRYDGLARVGPYKDPLKGLILAYKYGRQRDLGPVLGRLLAERVALAPWADLVDMVAPVPRQTRLPADRRAENVRGAFAVRGGASAVQGLRLLLVDDVLTSGATVGECARVLKRAGAASVFAAVVAVAGPNEPGPW